MTKSDQYSKDLFNQMIDIGQHKTKDRLLDKIVEYIESARYTANCHWLVLPVFSSSVGVKEFRTLSVLLVSILSPSPGFSKNTVCPLVAQKTLKLYVNVVHGENHTTSILLIKLN